MSCSLSLSTRTRRGYLIQRNKESSVLSVLGDSPRNLEYYAYPRGHDIEPNFAIAPSKTIQFIGGFGHAHSSMRKLPSCGRSVQDLDLSQIPILLSNGFPFVMPVTHKCKKLRPEVPGSLSNLRFVVVFYPEREALGLLLGSLERGCSIFLLRSCGKECLALL